MLSKQTFSLREWELSDAKNLALAINNKKILDNLRDGIPYPYTERDGLEQPNSVTILRKNIGGKV